MKELESILKNIKNKELLPIYFFHGEEPYFMDVAVKALENEVLSEDEKAFNQTVVYGKDTTFGDILALARQFPMMGDKQLIIVKEAQDIRLVDKEAEALKIYAENPVESTVLVFAYKHKKLDTRRAFAKKLDSGKMLFLSEKLKESAVPGWIEKQIKTAGLQTKPHIPTLLSQYLGNDLSRIINEVQKLKLILGAGAVLDELAIETHIGISKEFNVFELINALGRKDKTASYKISHFMAKNPKQNPFVLVMGNLYTYFSNLIIYHTIANQSSQTIAAALKISPYFVKDYAVAAKNYNLRNSTRIISLLREADLKVKGLGVVNTDEEELMRELVYKILHVEQFKVQV